ncbi:MAG: tetraacyldisaccharide 4'-kinase [Odoribacter sp.]
MTHTKVLLLPLSVIYGMIVGFRNILFHLGILKSRSFSIPIICVGNITVGGTGKTPHTELIISTLQEKFRVACLSRGYKRKTSGFILSDVHSTAREIGDEPMQIKNKFPNIQVACDEKRVRGIKKLLALSVPPEVIILDDGFQHRYVQADKNIILVDYSHPIHEDCLLPAGRLREDPGALKRADYIIVTKCPKDILPIERRILSKQLKIRAYQQLFFTSLEYGCIYDLTGQAKNMIPSKKSTLLCLTGIAQPATYVEYLKTFTEDVRELHYPDHHDFHKKDIENIENVFQKIGNKEKYIFTTEKDAMRLKGCELSTRIKSRIYYIPVVPKFIQDENVLLNEISEYVRKNKK